MKRVDLSERITEFQPAGDAMSALPDAQQQQQEEVH